MQDVVFVGLGELGRLLAGGALRAGCRVTPIVRGTDPTRVLSTVPARTPLFVCVGEGDLADAVMALPTAVRDDVVLLQNELFPDVWHALGISTPTVMVPWILQKRGLPTRIMQPTPVCGPHAALVGRIHEALGFPWKGLTMAVQREDALIAKYAFIVTINALGTLENRTLGAWLQTAPGAVLQLAGDAIAIAIRRVGRPPEDAARLHDPVWTQIENGMKALHDVPSAGRTAAVRVQRALNDARRWDVATGALDQVARGVLPKA